MAIELIGLAYNQNLAHDFWSNLKAIDLYTLILEDVYRKRIDYRSMRYHTGQMQLLNEIEELIFQNGEDLTIYQLIGQRFLKGVERTPFTSGFMEFDYQVIKYFASLATADNFIRSEKLFKEILQLNGELSSEDHWTFFDVEDYKVLHRSLEAFSFKDIDKLEDASSGESTKIDVPKWLTHYNEFFHYTYNNQLDAFFYNNTSAIKDWGDLLFRHNERNKSIVKSTFKYGSNFPQHSPSEDMLKLQSPVGKREELGLNEKMKVYKEASYLLEGLDDYDPLVQQKSAESLCDFIYTDDYNQTLMQKFDEVDLPIKRELIRALAKSINGNVEQFMLGILDSDESIDIQVLAAYALVKNSSAHIAQKLCDKLLNGERRFSVLLGKLIKTGQYKAIEKQLCDRSAWKQETAYEELAYVLGLCSVSEAQKSLHYLIERREDLKTLKNSVYALKKTDPNQVNAELFSKMKLKHEQLDEAQAVLCA